MYDHSARSSVIDALKHGFFCLRCEGRASGIGYQVSLSGSFAVSVDPNAGTAEWGLFLSGGVEANTSTKRGRTRGVTLFVGEGSLSGLPGSSTSVQVGSIVASGNEKIITVGYNFGPPSVSMTTGPANSAEQLIGDTYDLSAPFRGFYTWINSLSEQAWLPYAPPEPFPLGPDQ
jgi:hypothetical protein